MPKEVTTFELVHALRCSEVADLAQPRLLPKASKHRRRENNSYYLQVSTAESVHHLLLAEQTTKFR
jgi:hypothetical protein